MSRTHIVLIAVFVAPILAAWVTSQHNSAASWAEAAELDMFPGEAAVQIAGLKDQLEKGLKARRPQEFKFIGKVVAMVENDELPLRLVNISFQWARTRHPTYPFPYFENSLYRLCKKEGIEI